jgi:hypothetical protein
VLQYFGICGEKRKSLVDDLVAAAELPNFTIPSETRKTAVLHAGWKLRVGCDHLVQMAARNIAYADQSRSAGITLFPHCFPNFGIGASPSASGRWTVQHETVDVVCAQMFE